MSFVLREATPNDVAVLTELIQRSVRELQTEDYDHDQREGAIAGVYGVDTQLIHDGTYFVVESDGREIVGCGGWSKRRTLFGGDHYTSREDDFLDPAREAAKIRAFFIKPGFTRKGIGTLILDHCEQKAKSEGFTRLEMGATLTGVALYKARGYAADESINVPLPNGHQLPIVRMSKQI